MTIAETIEQICSGLVSGITTLGGGLASGVKDFVQNLFYTTTGTGAEATTTLSTFMVVVVVGGAISLAVGITTKIFNWIENIA